MPRSSSRLTNWACALLLASGVLVDASPEFTDRFKKLMPIPKQKEKTRTILNPITNKPIDYYEIEIKDFKVKGYSDGPLKDIESDMVGYDSQYPGQTIMVERGTESVVRFVNKSPSGNTWKGNSSIHLHGSPTRPPWDGWAEDRIQSGEFKDYYYPNHQNARMLWYHDHVLDHSADTVYFGQAGAYIITDEEERKLNLPSGYGINDLPIIISSKTYDNNGKLIRQGNGDVIDVNGQAWPYYEVSPRKYRLRFLDAAISRSFNLYFEDPDTKKPIDVSMIASDAGLFDKPVTASAFSINPAERYEVVIDFKNYKGKSILLRNAEDPATATGIQSEVMLFKVKNEDVVDDSTVPAQLRTFTIPQAPATSTPKTFEFRNVGGVWKINEKGWTGTSGDVLANVPRGTIQRWKFFNNAAVAVTHPVHTHLIDFHVVERTGGREAFPYEKQGLKDVIWIKGGETVTVDAHYGPWDGLYMMHCHNLAHEDNQMIGAFNVQSLADLGYPETSFVNPMEAEYLARPTSDARFGDKAAADAWVQKVARSKPYSDLKEITAKIEEYWKNRPSTGAKMAREWQA